MRLTIQRLQVGQVCCGCSSSRGWWWCERHPAVASRYQPGELLRHAHDHAHTVTCCDGMFQAVCFWPTSPAAIWHRWWALVECCGACATQAGRSKHNRAASSNAAALGVAPCVQVDAVLGDAAGSRLLDQASKAQQLLTQVCVQQCQQGRCPWLFISVPLEQLARRRPVPGSDPVQTFAV